MKISLNEAINLEKKIQLDTIPELDAQQMALLNKLHLFAIHQTSYNEEAKRIPVKMSYKVNDELKLAIIAILTTCSLLDIKRSGRENRKFFEDQIKIIQKDNTAKTIDFGKIRPGLLQEFLVPEIVEDWILYRDVNGDGIYALMDSKTYLQGLKDYAKGGEPVYEFARFYRTYMRDRLFQQTEQKKRVQDIAVRSLIDQVIQQRLADGCSPQTLLENALGGNYDNLLSNEKAPSIKALPKK